MPSSATAAIHTVLAFDGNFWAPAYATMRSVALFSRARKNLVFHLCHKGVAAEYRTILSGIEKEFGASIVWHDLDRDTAFQAALSGLKDSKRLGIVIYARMLIERFVPGDAARAIYLDCDVMMREPIERLWASDLDGRAIGAVRDPWYPFLSMGRDIKDNTDLFDPADRYFNSGLLLIDLEKWREARVWDRLAALIADGTMARIYYDQDALNIIFKGNWTELDHRWNVIDPRPAHEAIDPFMLHYTGPSKPWNLRANVAFFRLYRHVMTNDIYYRFLRERIARRVRRLNPFKRGRPG